MKPLCDGREASEVAMWSVGRNTGHRKIQGVHSRTTLLERLLSVQYGGP